MKRNLFIWIPKTSGTSFYRSLSKRDSSFKLELNPETKIKHGTHGHIKIDLIYNKEELEEFEIFTIVRNPYSRFISLFEYSKRKDITNIEIDTTIYEFIELIEKGIPPVGKYNRDGLSQCNPQVDWIKNVDNVKIYKFEDMCELYSDFNIKKRWSNKSVFRPYEEYYTPDIKMFVETYYKEDFNLLNYSVRSI